MATHEEIREKHGTPEEFETAIWEAYAQLFVTMEEALKAIAKYHNEWHAATLVDRPRGIAISVLSLAVLFHETYERLAPVHGYETRLETRKFDASSPNGKLMIATCEAVLGELSKLP